MRPTGEQMAVLQQVILFEAIVQVAKFGRVKPLSLETFVLGVIGELNRVNKVDLEAEKLFFRNETVDSTGRI